MHFFRVQPPFLLGEGLIELTRYNFERDLARARFGADDGASTGSGSASDSAVKQSTGVARLSSVNHICVCDTLPYIS